MAVTVTDIFNDITSDRSRRIAVTAGSSLADVIAGIETVLTTAPGGWSIHDASAGTNAKCYKSLQKDGTSYTYMVLDWNTTISAGVAGLIIRLYEDWNATAHTGTNKADNSKDRGGNAISEDLQGQRLPHGETDPWQIDIHVLPGGGAFFSSREVSQASSNSAYLGSPTYGGVTLVGECLRENPNTLPTGVPVALWLNSGHVSGAYGSLYGQISVCRTFDARNPCLYTGLIYPGLCTLDTCGLGKGYTDTSRVLASGIGGRSYVSRMVPMVAAGLSYLPYEHADLGAIRGVMCVGPGNTNNSVWEVATDSDYLVSPGGTNRKFRCYVPSGGPMCLLLPI